MAFLFSIKIVHYCRLDSSTMRTFWALAVLPLVVVAQLTCKCSLVYVMSYTILAHFKEAILVAGFEIKFFHFHFAGRTRFTERYGQELLQRNEWGRNELRMTMIDIGKPLRAGILERFVAYMHRDYDTTTRMRFQIWYPVDENRGSYRLDYEQIVVIPSSNGRFTVSQ